MALKFNGKELSVARIEEQLVSNLVPDGVELVCLISGAEFVKGRKFDNGNTSPDLVKIDFTVSEEGRYLRKSASKKFKLEGSGMASGVKGLEELFDIVGIDFEHDLTNTAELKKALINQEVLAEFKIFVTESKSNAMNYIGKISSVKDEEANINSLADGRKPTATAGFDDFDDGIPF